MWNKILLIQKGFEVQFDLYIESSDSSIVAISILGSYLRHEFYSTILDITPFSLFYKTQVTNLPGLRKLVNLVNRSKFVLNLYVFPKLSLKLMRHTLYFFQIFLLNLILLISVIINIFIALIFIGYACE